MPKQQAYVVFSREHNGFWTDGFGITLDLSKAGRFQRDRAMNFARDRNSQTPQDPPVELAMPFEDAEVLLLGVVARSAPKIGFMSVEDKIDLAHAMNEALGEMRESSGKVRELMVASTAANLIETAVQFAPGEEDFREAVHASGPNGDHALIAVEDELASFFKSNPDAVDMMRSSREWDNEVRKDDASRAAMALVNESMSKAEECWPERMAAVRAPAPR